MLHTHERTNEECVCEEGGIENKVCVKREASRTKCVKRERSTSHMGTTEHDEEHDDEGRRLDDDVDGVGEAAEDEGAPQNLLGNGRSSDEAEEAAEEEEYDEDEEDEAE